LGYTEYWEDNTPGDKKPTILTEISSELSRTVTDE